MRAAKKLSARRETPDSRLNGGRFALMRMTVAIDMNKYYFSIALFAMTAFPCVPVSAQNMPAPLRETLKDIPAAGMACRKEDFADKPQGAAAPPLRKSDPGCAITLEQLSSSLGKPDTVMIDTRAKAAFDTSHIDGAVNFSSAELRTKRYLADKRVVLLGDGKRDQDLYELCSELKAAGFKQTRVLRGGMLAWLLDNKPVVGVASNFADLSSLNPGELFQESKMADSVLIGLPSMRHLADVLPMMQSVSADSPAAVKEFIQKRKKARSLQTIIVVADERFDRSEIATLAALAKPEPLLLYADSEGAYRQFLRVQNAMWAKQAKGPTKPRCGGL